MSNVVSVISTIVLVIFLVSLIFKYKVDLIMKLWFLLVIIIASTISINSIFIGNISNHYILASVFFTMSISIFLGIKKVFYPNKYLNYLTDVLIYPGIAVLFIHTIFGENITKNIVTLFSLLILISVYDYWAVRKSKIMTKMAKYQIEKLNVFGGILIPVMSKEDKLKLKNIRTKYKEKAEIEKQVKRSKIKFSAAVLGGGDIAFTTIAMGILMHSYSSKSLFGVPGLIPGLFVLLGSTLGILYIFIFGDKDKPYPAMPYITIGIILSTLIFLIGWC